MFLCEMFLFLFPLSLVIVAVTVLFLMSLLFSVNCYFNCDLYPLCLQLERGGGAVHALSRCTKLENTIPKTTLTGAQYGAQRVEITSDLPRVGWKQI